MGIPTLERRREGEEGKKGERKEKGR